MAIFPDVAQPLSDRNALVLRKSSALAAEQEPSYAALASISTRSCPNGIPPRDELLLLFDREIGGLLQLRRVLDAIGVLNPVVGGGVHEPEAPLR
jgi:hypothetical protein